MEGQIHEEKHLESSDFLRDVVIGMSDGLTVPFALAAGLTGAVSSSSIIVIAGMQKLLREASLWDWAATLPDKLNRIIIIRN